MSAKERHPITGLALRAKPRKNIAASFDIDTYNKIARASHKQLLTPSQFIKDAVEHFLSCKSQ